MTNGATKGSAREVSSEGKQTEALNADRRATATAGKKFLDAHPELSGNEEYFGPIVGAGLVDEYRDDLRQAMIANGEEADDVERMLRTAKPHEIATAHQFRRLNGDPNVRQIDHDMIEAAYQRAGKKLGIGSQQHQRQEFQTARQGRKDDLRTQPKRSSVPPATRQPAEAVNETSIRKDAVREMQQMRGQKIR